MILYLPLLGSAPKALLHWLGTLLTKTLGAASAAACEAQKPRAVGLRAGVVRHDEARGGGELEKAHGFHLGKRGEWVSVTRTT